MVICFYTIPSFNQFFKEAWDVLSSDDEARIRDWVGDFGWFGPFLIVLAMIAQMFLLVVPTLLLMIVSVLAYGPVWGSLISIAAVFTASTVGYWDFCQLRVHKTHFRRKNTKQGKFIRPGLWILGSSHYTIQSFS